MKKRIISILLTASMLVGIIAMTAVPSSAAHPFTDVPDWATEYVNEVYEKGIMQGTGGTSFGSNATLTREQLVVTLYRISGSTITGTLDSLKATFADAADISDWAWSAVEWASKEGITSGVKQGDALYFKPKNDVTRQEAAKFFITFIDYMKLDAPTDNVANLKDMDKVGDWALPYVERCIAAGIINGDGNGNFDPAGKTVRIAAAKMLACLPEAKSGITYPDLKVQSQDRDDPSPSKLGLSSSNGMVFDEEIKVSQAVILDSKGSENLFTATALGVHGWHESRLVRTPYGTYVVFAQDERLGDEYVGYNGSINATVWGKFFLVKITDDGFKKVLEGEFPVASGSCAPNVLAGEDGMIYITTFSDDKDTYYGSYNADTITFEREAAFLAVYEFDTKTDTLVNSDIAVVDFKIIGVHGYGYYQPIVDTLNGKIYALFTGGLYPGYLSWFIYDIDTHKWEKQNYTVGTDFRWGYFNAYPDGKGGIFTVATRIAHSSSHEDYYNGEIKFGSSGYFWDAVSIMSIPDMYEEKVVVSKEVAVPKYNDEKEFPRIGGMIQGANVTYTDGGVTYLDSKGNLYVIYNYNSPKKSGYYYAVYDVNNNFKEVRINKELKLRNTSNSGYQFAMTETLDGNVYLVAVDTLPKEAELEIYKLDLSANKINTSVIKTKDGGVGYVKIKFNGRAGNVTHARLSFTGSRNFSIQDNVLGILSYECKPVKTGHQTTIVKNGFDVNKYGSVNWSGPGTEELFYYSIKFGE